LIRLKVDNLTRTMTTCKPTFRATKTSWASLTDETARR
jgi:hypothetical protein